MSASHFPEPRPANGGLAAEGALKLLGRPELDPLVILIREAAQNSWDARVDEAGPVRFDIDLRRVDLQARQVLTDKLFGEIPPRGIGLDELAAVLDGDQLSMMLLTDTGTRGLGGPIRADTKPAEGESTDFVDLVFNIGQPPDHKFGGGTYGFGKTISYLMSRCRTVVIHTVTEHHGKLQHRLIAQAIGRQYSYEEKNYTGRHWWGSAQPHGVEPITGEAAEGLASLLGLPDLKAAGGGTTLVILDPDLTGKTPEQAATFLANGLTWNFWPKMVPDWRKRPAMEFSVTCEGRAVPVPEPDDTPPLKAFADSLRAVRDCEAGRKKPDDFPAFHVFELRSQRPNVSLGWLALHSVAARPRPELDEGLDDEGEPTTAASFSEPSHHVALMRRAELVVQYRPGPELTNPAVEWAGVFKGSELIDAALAEAEPPTHDDWRSKLVAAKPHRRNVNAALREIKAKVNGAFGAPMDEPGGDEKTGAVVIADALGHLLATHLGTGASRPVQNRQAQKAARRTVPKVNVLRQWLDQQNGTGILKVEFEVLAAVGSVATLVEVVAAAANADGEFENNPPIGAPVPRVQGFNHGRMTVEGHTISVPAEDEGPVVVVVSQPDSVAAVIDIRAVADKSDT